MITITTANEIAAAYDKAEKQEGAFATCRCLPGQWEQENEQEWAEHCEIEGVPAKVFYIFSNEEAEVEDGGDMPWDADHVSKIQLAEKDEDGDFETL
jgi:hypothetical protein